MLNFATSIDEVTVEIYRRAVRLYAVKVSPWVECLNEAVSSIQIELDHWLIAPMAAGSSAPARPGPGRGGAGGSGQPPAFGWRASCSAAETAGSGRKSWGV